MTPLNKILAAVLAAQLVLAAIVLTRGEDVSIGKLEPVVTLGESPTRVQIFAGAPAGDGVKPDPSKPAIDLVKRGDGYVLASHFDYPALATEVSGLVDKLRGLRARAAIATGTARARQLEVADDKFQRKVVVSEAGKPDVVLLLGSAAGPNQTAVRVAGKDEIHAVTGLTAYGIATEPSAYVSRALLATPKERVAQVLVTNGHGTFEISRAGEAWQLAIDGKPAVAPAGQELDSTKLADLVDRAATLELSAPADPKREIARPEATLTVRLSPPAATPGAPSPAEAVSTANDETVLDLASDKDDRYLVRQRGGGHAPVLVDGARVRELVDLDRDKLFRKPGAAAPPAPGPDTPGMETLPPEILEQLRHQQGAGGPGGPP